MRSLVLAAAIALTLAGTAGGARAQGFARGPYTWDSSGVCHDGTGNKVPETLCQAAQKPKKVACHDPSTGKAESCTTSGAVPDSPPNKPQG
jgi:hypothetical protein